MKKIYLIIFSFVSWGMLGQCINENYIITTTCTAPTTDVSLLTASQKQVSIVYYDGLGRPKQKIDQQASGHDKNLFTHIPYDGFGRQIQNYLPAEINDQTLNCVPTANIQTSLDQFFSTFRGVTANPYTEKLLEPSPLGRILKEAAPGNSWAMGSGHEVKYEYQTNILNEVRQFTIAVNWNATSKYYSALPPSSTIYYNPGRLFKTIVKDENWVSGTNNTTEEFKEKDGKIVLKRTYNGVDQLSTYYVYDQYGNLNYVLPPNVDLSAPITQTVLDRYCYQYRYDSRNRIVEKKVPGKQWEFIVYDKLDRVVATGPSFSPFTNGTGQGWLFTKYDTFNRPCITGWTTGTLTSSGRVALQNDRDTQNLQMMPLNESRTSTTAVTTFNGVSFKYSNSAWPVLSASIPILTVNYYDSYDFPGAPADASIPSFVMSDQTQPVKYRNTDKPKGMPTGKYVRVPELSTSTGRGETTYMLYDEKAFPVRTYKTNYLTGYFQVDSKVDFVGKTIKSETTYRRISSSDIFSIAEEFTYTNQGRPLIHTHKFNTGSPQLLSKNTYDAFGDLEIKKVGGTDVSGATCLQKMDYTYNIRGWLKGINDVNSITPPPTSIVQAENPWDLFNFKLNYDTLEDQATYVGKELYNGNISESYWRTGNDNQRRKYAYTYDYLNRLKLANYIKGATGSTDNTQMYNEAIWYDKVGNISNLTRNGDYDDASAVNPLQIDQLTYSYTDTDNPNRLTRILDGATTAGFKDVSGVQPFEYDYDLNGNMTKDIHKGIYSNPITYNHVNQPNAIIFNNGNKIEYLYNALGQKVKKTVTENSVVTTIDYLDGFQTNNGALELLPTSEGYISVSQGLGNPNTFPPTLPSIRWSYVYNYLDHLGNIRISFGLSSGKVKILSENNYYPFGMKHKNYNVTQMQYEDSGGEIDLTTCTECKYKYKYNGKEWQDELGLNIYEYGSRNYDPVIGRWLSPDIYAEKAVSWTPYRYAFNNPMTFVDPDGNYETDGHYWTVYLAALMTGHTNARELAYYAEIPDNRMSDRGDILNSTNTWAYLDWQVDVHALTGGTREDEVRKSEIGYFRTNNARQQGYSLHRYGDSHAHSDDDGDMYWTGPGHLFRGHSPDKIANRPELYLEYANGLVNMLGGFQKDMFTFEYVAKSGGTTEQNSAVFETEVRLLEGQKTFSVGGNQVDAIKNYMNARNGHTKTTTNMKVFSSTGDRYKPNGKGGWTKTTETRTYVIFQ
ncbi:DUF6443 domain-containing protein [Flavobacterium silvaticum]|uniref:RHS repeat-associated core domain-containing protein n=1 Tax=Flavobacterium silvaticum TaxID=1852020 RepID=A0A972JJV8_9FLAO|nr:DUF6443 domain-containing protein [Flavobacterium silvaticum]NMH28497.1 RHS repeat-associated core domain-containing protein [Flavobacterium silvaticum]